MTTEVYKRITLHHDLGIRVLSQIVGVDEDIVFRVLGLETDVATTTRMQQDGEDGQAVPGGLWVMETLPYLTEKFTIMD